MTRRIFVFLQLVLLLVTAALPCADACAHAYAEGGACAGGSGCVEQSDRGHDGASDHRAGHAGREAAQHGDTCQCPCHASVDEPLARLPHTTLPFSRIEESPAPAAIFIAHSGIFRPPIPA